MHEAIKKIKLKKKERKKSHQFTMYCYDAKKFEKIQYIEKKMAFTYLQGPLHIDTSLEKLFVLVPSFTKIIKNFMKIK